MSTPTGTNGNSGDPQDHDQSIEPIDPTLTIDAYFEKKSTTPTEITSDDEPTDDETASDHHAVTDHQNVTDDEENSYYTSDYPHSSEPEPTYDDGAYAESEPARSAYPEPDDHQRFSETAAPARFSAPNTGQTLTAEAPVTTAPDSVDVGPAAMRMRTVVIGLVLLVIAGAVLIGQLTDVTVNATAVLLALMIGGGLLLIAGARRS
jgi:hypothetical protein